MSTGNALRLRWLVLAGATLVLGWASLVAAAGASVASPPRITIESPKDGAVVHTSTATVKGKFTVAPVNGPSPHVTAALNGRQLDVSVNGPVSYDFARTAKLTSGRNELVVVVNDGDGGESSASVAVKYVPIRPTQRQCVSDKRGDSHDHFTHMDIVGACARRRGAKVVFSITTAKPPPKIHDGFGNPAAPCFEVPRAPPSARGPAPIQSCGDAVLRGWTQNHWPKVPFAISGRVSTWKVPLKYLPKSTFKWRAYVSNADHQVDKAPDGGYLSFAVRPPR